MPPTSNPVIQTIRRRGPSPAKTAKTRRDIVTAAFDLFLENGFSATRMIDVAQRAGVAKGTLYLYFADKESLFEGILREVLAAPIDNLSTAAPKEGERIRDFIRRTMGPFVREMEISGRAALVRLVVAEGPRFPALAELHYRLVLEPMLGFMRRMSELAFASGEISTDATARYPQLMAAPGLIVAIWNGLFGKTRPIDGAAVLEAWLDLVFRTPPGETEKREPIRARRAKANLKLRTSR